MVPLWLEGKVKAAFIIPGRRSASVEGYIPEMRHFNDCHFGPYRVKISILL